MSDARTGEHQPSHPETAAEADPEVAQLLGLRPPDSDAVATEDEVDTLGEMTDTRVYQGDLEARPPDSDQPDDDRAENLESLVATELRAGETDDPNEAAEEGMTWVPPIDPPLRVGDEGEPEVAAGFGTTAQEEPFDADHHGSALSARDEVETRVLEALRADATTSGLADRIELDVEGGVVRLAGAVEDLVDEDAILAVVEAVDGVTIVDSRITVVAVEKMQIDRS
ncbi:MAG TPA: BON domain-containing protein [Candidatus Limnocylindrales bacterium]|nr:BON domain-containing protein [Candidatus Limnocylindrales bacterium]